MQLITICLLATLGLPALAQSTSIKDRLKAAQTASFAQHEGVMIEASRAIQALPRKMDGTWDQTQIKFIVSLMEVETDEVYRQQMIEDSAVHFKDSRKLFLAELKRLPPAQAKQLQFDIDAVIKVHDHGNNVN